jgi:Protein of unknown function (DUF3499)
MLAAAMDAPFSLRRCARPVCNRVAAATLSYDYRTRTGWLDEDVEPHPSRHDLCLTHAGQLRVPDGWRLIDRRHTVVALPSPAAG